MIKAVPFLYYDTVPYGRFPRAWPQPPQRASSLAGSSAHAIPAGVARLSLQSTISSCAKQTIITDYNVRMLI